MTQVTPVKASVHPLKTLWRVVAWLVLLAATSVVQAADARTLNALFDGILAEHVKDGYVDYPAIARNVRFSKYLESLADFNLETLTDDKERLAF